MIASRLSPAVRRPAPTPGWLGPAPIATWLGRERGFEEDVIGVRNEYSFLGSSASVFLRDCCRYLGSLVNFCAFAECSFRPHRTARGRPAADGETARSARTLSMVSAPPVGDRRCVVERT